MPEGVSPVELNQMAEMVRMFAFSGDASSLMANALTDEQRDRFIRLLETDADRKHERDMAMLGQQKEEALRRDELRAKEAEREASHRRWVLVASTVLAAAGAVSFLVLCGMFIFTGKPDQILPILTPILTFLGGVGLGRVSDARASAAPAVQPPPPAPRKKGKADPASP